eukprot:COSAG06_NODE_2770_length_6314_cov_1.878681_3_plen_91_part_00
MMINVIIDSCACGDTACARAAQLARSVNKLPLPASAAALADAGMDHASMSSSSASHVAAHHQPCVGPSDSHSRWIVLEYIFHRGLDFLTM